MATRRPVLSTQIIESPLTENIPLRLASRAIAFSSDTGHIQDKSQRPTDAEYDRFLWLVNLMKTCQYDDTAIQRTLPLLVQDVFFSGILAAANHALANCIRGAGFMEGT